MVSRENRVIAGAFLIFAIGFLGLTVAEHRFGVLVDDSPLLAYLLLVGVAVVGPQLYLAATGDDVSPRYRLWFAAVAAAGFGSAIASDAVGLQWTAIVAIAGSVFLIAAYYEAVAGYRASQATES
ncbi:hypothetical protein [Halosolutus gelatinilyticus]|uniref:hypothetical protein n=1 Tax=Halosolutus gelatinilyticus TaxID=2931975 RepID=UPI001FF19B60|nr:hypothetical protein [Halosolutus gelatinilyticus]